MQRRRFLKQLSTGVMGCACANYILGAQPPEASPEDQRILELINSQRPSRLERLPADFNARFGATHVAGKYYLTKKPFLLEGGEKLLELGTRLGKFWFEPKGTAHNYPFNSQWGQYQTLVDLAKSDYFQQLFALPFSTIILETHTPAESGWNSPQPAEFYERVSQEFYDLTAHLYKTYRERAITFVIQHWEGDWLLRGAGKNWDPPPEDWSQRCAQMQKWLAARQAGVTKARTEELERGGPRARCTVAHAAEVNRVADIWKGIPTMTDKVLPQLDLDLVSYSCYDAMKDSLTLWKCIAEIRKHARTGVLFGEKAIYLGEIGIPENEQPKRLTERWDEFMGVALAAKVLYTAHWELFCNEIKTNLKPTPKPPITDLNQMRGFWLVRPDGSLSESGQYFQKLWQRGKSD